ncbi:hypothetical protein H4Q26_018355 [Puccinia striiformis f. sp. tritici PST-130]|nr:hypothetical protein H4Q26_018355 [Puccinia striiformis f. sp. tritici PST-130]
MGCNERGPETPADNAFFEVLQVTDGDWLSQLDSGRKKYGKKDFPWKRRRVRVEMKAFTILCTILVYCTFLSRADALNRRQRGGGGASPTFKFNSAEAKAQARLAQSKGLLGQSRDGDVKVVPMTAEIDGFAVQFKVAGSDLDLKTAAIKGAVIHASEQGSVEPPTSTGKGINLLLHGDGGQSFFDFSNVREQQGLLGVVALAPNDKMFWGGGAGNRRTDGVLHSKLLDELITKVLPQVINMDSSKVFFMGISGGSFLLAGFFLPAFAEKYNSGVILGCGGLPPQVKPSSNFGKTLGTMRVHVQTSTNEQDGIQVTIPLAIQAYIKLAQQAGVDNQILGQKFTADLSPKGSHCAFDGKGFVSGVQLLADNYANIILGDGDAIGIGKVATSVLDNRQKFASGLPLTKVVSRARRAQS